jgi:hypothetical protein
MESAKWAILWNNVQAECDMVVKMHADALTLADMRAAVESTIRLLI